MVIGLALVEVGGWPKEARDGKCNKKSGPA